MSKLKTVAHKVSMIQIPENALLHEILVELEGREAFKDTEEDLGERIYTGDIFEAILGEQSELEKRKNIIDVKTLSHKALTQLDELAELVDTEYVQITKI